MDEAENASSDEAIFSIDCTEPVVVELPEEGAITNQSFIVVSGWVEDASRIEEVKVGDVIATLSGVSFTASPVELPLEGMNTIVVTATDAAENYPSTATGFVAAPRMADMAAGMPRRPSLSTMNELFMMSFIEDSMYRRRNASG